MLSKVIETIRKNNMILPGEKVLAGLSGGADSMCLVHVLHSLQRSLDFELHALHVHHHLRGEEADRDASCARSFAERLDVPFIICDADVYTRAQDEKESLETAARHERYRLLFEEAEKNGCKKIAIAHHLDDQAETVVYRWMRGSGPEGLAGMEYVRVDGVIRPLLGITRKEIEAYCCSNSIEYCIDSSNLKDFCVRNTIRLDLLPLLEEKYNPAIRKIITRTAEQFSVENDFWDGYLEEVSSRLCLKSGDTVTIADIAVFNNLHLAVRRRLIRQILLELKHGMPLFSYKNIERVIDFFAGSTSCSTLSWPGGIFIKKEYNTALLAAADCKDKCVESVGYLYKLKVPGITVIPEAGIEVSVIEIDTCKDFSYDEKAVCIDIYSDSISMPLYVRGRRPGDRFRPVGLNGTRKLQDYYVDKKVPRDQRDRVPILADEEGILWIVGGQMDERCAKPGGSSVKLRIKATAIN